jgi:hypothetical protein
MRPGSPHDSNNRGKEGGKFKFGFVPASGALRRAGEGGEKKRAEYNADDSDQGKDKTLPAGQALAVGLLRAKGRNPSAREGFYK